MATKHAKPIRQPTKKRTVGWREWAALPGLGVKALRTKVDTGAVTSSLHATDIEEFGKKGDPWVRFRLYAGPKGSRKNQIAEAPLVGIRRIRNSIGRAESRPVIKEKVRLAGRCWTVEFTLTDRKDMDYPMLLGRQAIARRFLVDPGRSWLFPKPVKKS